MSARAVVPRVVKAVVGNLVKIAERDPNLRTVASVKIKMCPWEKNSASTKEFWRKVSGEEIRETNKKCAVTTTMLHDKSEPIVNVEFNDGEKLILKGANLQSQELMYHFNAFCHHKEEAMKDEPQKLF